MAKTIKKEKEVEVVHPTEITPIELLKENDVKEIIEKYEPPKPTYRKELDTTFPFEERIEAFIESRGQDQYIQLNDFLKSLYGVPAFNTPPKWQNQSAMKQLNGILEKMQTEGKIQIELNTHRTLGKHYYEGVQQAQVHHNLNTVTIKAKK